MQRRRTMSSVYLTSTGIQEYDAWLLISQVYELCETIQRRGCQMAGISPSAFDVLYLVKSQPKPLTAYKVAMLLGHKHHSVVEIVNRLRTKGLLKRQTVNGKSSLEITDAGDKALVKALSKPLPANMIGSMGADRIKRLIDDLMPLRQAAMQELGLLDRGEVRLQPPTEMRLARTNRTTSASS
jgi:DNA-binding MarR family transcriptional regulator